MALLEVLAGWHIHLEHLDETLDGQPVDWENWSMDRWRVLRDRYAEIYG